MGSAREEGDPPRVIAGQIDVFAVAFDNCIVCNFVPLQVDYLDNGGAPVKPDSEPVSVGFDSHRLEIGSSVNVQLANYVTFWRNDVDERWQSTP